MIFSFQIHQKLFSLKFHTKQRQWINYTWILTITYKQPEKQKLPQSNPKHQTAHFDPINFSHTYTFFRNDSSSNNWRPLASVWVHKSAPTSPLELSVSINHAIVSLLRSIMTRERKHGYDTPGSAPSPAHPWFLWIIWEKVHDHGDLSADILEVSFTSDGSILRAIIWRFAIIESSIIIM